MNDLAAELRRSSQETAATLRSLQEADVTQERGAGKWVKKEILGHLIDSALNNHQCFVRAQFADQFIWPGYNQRAWVEVQRYRERPWRELVDLWVCLNQHIATAIESMPVEKLQTPCIIGGQEARLLERVRDYVRHLDHHVDQIVRG